MANSMSEPAQHKAALTGPHVRLVAGIGVIVLITGVFLYIYAKSKQNGMGSDTSAGSLGSGQSGSAWDSLTYNLNYTPASSGSTNNPGAPGTPASSPSTPASPATPSTPAAPSAPTPTSSPAAPAHSGGGSKRVVKKSTHTAPAHSGGHSSPAHPSSSAGLGNLTRATVGAGRSLSANSKSSYGSVSGAANQLNTPGGVNNVPVLGGIVGGIVSLF